MGVLRIIVYLAWTVIALPLQVVAVRLHLPLRRRLPLIYHSTCLRLLGIRLKVYGRRSRARPTLFVSNHSSYLDIMILGGLVPGSFVAKAEVARWPFFGLLAKLQETVFVDRKASSAREQRASLLNRLEASDNLILFPEGTSSDGNRTLPFKSALFAVADLRVDGAPLTVQPVSIAATALDGIPLGRMMRSLYAWYGDMALLPHIWRVAGAGRLTVVVQFPPPVTIDTMGSRKALAEACWKQVADGVAAANAGRLPASRRRRRRDGVAA